MFSQERAPTSVAYAENQSMFLDSFIGDAAWKGRYALNRSLRIAHERECMFAWLSSCHELAYIVQIEI